MRTTIITILLFGLVWLSSCDDDELPVLTVVSPEAEQEFSQDFTLTPGHMTIHIVFSWDLDGKNDGKPGGNYTTTLGILG